MALQELQIYGLWAGKQTAKGTKNAAPAKRFKQPAGAFNVPRTDGSENYSDATQFPDTVDWVDTLIGNGTPGLHATPEELAWVFWALEGGETTTAVTGPPAKTKHTAVPLPGLGHWTTWATRQGSSVIDRYSHNDCQISQLVVEGGTGSKAVRATPTIYSLDPGEITAADPAQAMPTKATFLYTDGTGRFTIDGTVFRGHSAFTLTINKDLQPVYSDDVLVYDLAIGNASITISVTLFFDAASRAQFNKLLYGTAAPPTGTKPIKNIPALGSYLFDLRARDNTGAANGDKFVLTMAGVKWAVPDYPDPNPDGGPSEITLAGSMRKSGASPAYQVDIDNDAAAYTV
jgi:hypothetical protein